MNQIDICKTDMFRDLRIEKGLSIQKLSALSGVSASHISRIESGKRNPSKKTLSKIAPHLSVEASYLLSFFKQNESHIKSVDLSEVY